MTSSEQSYIFQQIEPSAQHQVSGSNAVRIAKAMENIKGRKIDHDEPLPFSDEREKHLTDHAIKMTR